MRVLLAHNRYRRPGGEEHHIDIIQRSLERTGAEVRTFFRDSASLESSSWRRALAGATLAYNPRAGGIDDDVRGWRPDVVHFHNTWPLLTPAAMRHAKRAGAATVLTVHNSRFGCPGGTCTLKGHSGEEGLRRNRCIAGSPVRCALANNPRGNLGESALYGTALEIQRRLQMLRRWVDAFIAPSHYAAAMLELIGIPPERVHVIPNGVPVSQTPPSDPEFGLFVGRISDEKGIPGLIRAARSAPEVPVAAAGAGPLEQDLHPAGIRHLGQLDRESLEDTMARAAFVVIPSTSHETLPYAALEACAAGKPVIATTVGGMPEIVRPGKTGLLVAPGDWLALATAMKRLWNDQRLASRLGGNAQRMVAERFSVEDQVSRTLEVYRSACDTRS